MRTAHDLLSVARRITRRRAATRMARVLLSGIPASVLAALALSAVPASAAAEGSCPNETLRAESNTDPYTGVPYSTQLPDCRAYEQVTPPFKSTNAVLPGNESRTGTAVTASISNDGSSLLELSLPLLGTGGAGADQLGYTTAYGIRRGASGWTTTSLTPPASVFPISSEQLLSAADPAFGLWSAATPSQSINAEDFYLREADGTFSDIGPFAPAAATAGPPHGARPETKGPKAHIVGASADLSHVVFQLFSEGADLWPGDKTTEGAQSLYEYVGTGHTGEGADVPTLLGVDNKDEQIGVCGTMLGGNVESDTGTVRNGVSAGGSTIFFNVQPHKCLLKAPGPALAQLYARIGTPGAQTTVNVAGTSECASSTSCNVIKPVTYQASSKDGSRVFFTTTQALLPSDTDTTKDIYLCELPGDGGSTPAPAGVVNACPDLKAVSAIGTEAKVQSVAAISEDGSHVYFTAAGVLTSEPDLSLPPGHQVATQGAHNLYVWEAPGEGDPTGHIAFIASVSTASLSERTGGAQATPDGRYLVFSDRAKLTPDDKSTANQVFRFDAKAGELIRVSVGQGGFNNNGNTSEYPALLAPVELSRLTVSNDGSYIVFQSGDALTPQVQGHGRNAYEWHAGNVYLISDGTDTQQHSGLMGIDASGEDIFFTTADALVGQDTDEDFDIYDARIDGGFPAPIAKPSCSGEGCQGPPSSGWPAPPPPGSLAHPAIGNAAPATGGVLGTRTVEGAGKVQITKQSVKGSTVTLSVKVPAKGAISASGSRLKTIKRSVSKSATYTLKLTFTKAGKASLRKHHRLKVKIKVVFKPSTGASSSATKTVTFKA
jgi:hypothetical protein